MSIEAMKMALEALELFCECGTMDRPIERREALRQALAQEQEPVAWFVQYEYRHEFLWRKPNELEQDTALEITPLYTAPPKREWVGLTDEEMFGEHTKYLTRNEWAPMIEAKLKEKNG